jgi:Glycosyltransferase family 87
VTTVMTDMTPASELAARSGGISGAGLAATLTRPHMVVVLWLGVIFHSLALLHQLPSRANHFDFSIYYASGFALRHHIDPYTTDLDRIGHGLKLEIDPIHYATDPPTFLLCFEPLTLLPLRQAFWLWTALNLAALVASLVLLLRGSGLGVWTAFALAALAFLYPPVGEHFFYGQNKIFVLLMLALMMRWMADGHDAAAGFILGIAALMRGFPLLMVGYLVLRRRWRAIAYTVLGIVMGGLLTIAILGLPQTLSFSEGLRFVTKPRFLALPINVSLGAFVSRMYWYAFGPHGGISNFVRSVLVAAAEIGVLAMTVKATVKSRDAVDIDWRAFSLWVVTAVFLSPTAWVHYLVLMLIPFILMVIAANRGRANSRAIWMAVASFLLIALSTSGRTAFGPHPHGVFPIIIAECSFLSLVMVYVSAYWFASDEIADATEHRRASEVEERA